MFFKTLSSPRGCGCLLRGTPNSELASVKKVASFLVFARYNWRLEMSILIDAYARLPVPKRIIVDSKEQSPSDYDGSALSKPPSNIAERSNDEKLSDTAKCNTSTIEYIHKKKVD